MARNLNLEVILSATDKFTGVVKKVDIVSRKTAAAVKAAREQTRGLQKSMTHIRQVKRFEGQLKGVSKETLEARKRLRELKNQYEATDSPTKGLTRSLGVQQRRVERLEKKQSSLTRRMEEGRTALRKAGVDTSDMSAANEDLARKVERVNKKLATQKKWLGRVGRASEIAHGMLDRAFGVMKWGAGAATAAGAAMVPFIRTAAQFEKYQTTLETVEGSEAKAKQAMDWVSKFAVETPYELANVTDAYVKLRAYGLEPTGGLLRTLGDASSAMGKDITQAVEAIADAVTGENERLKDFGITAQTAGDKVTYNYTDKQGVQRQMEVMKNDRKAIENALREIWDEKFEGGMARGAKTMGGLWSNLMDQWVRFQQMVMQSGPFERIKGRMSELLDTINKMGENGELEALAERVGARMVQLIEAADTAARKLWAMGKAAFDVTSRIAGLVGGWENLAIILVSLKILPTVLMLGQLAGMLKTVAFTLKAVGIAAMANPIGLIIAAIAAAVAALGAVAYLVYKHWDTVSGWLSAAWDGIVGIAGRMWDRIKQAFDGGIGGVTALLLDWSPIGLLWSAISAGLAKLGIDLPSSLSGLGKAAVNGLIDGLFSMWAAVKATIGNLAGGVVNWFKEKLGIASPSKVFANFGGNLIEGLINGINAKWTALKTKITETAGGVVNWFKDKLGIQSPSKVFASIGDDTMAGMAVGLDRSSKEPIRKIDAFNQRLRRQAAGITIAASAGMAGAAGPAAAGSQPAGPVEYHFHIYAAPGQDAEAVGRSAMREAMRMANGKTGGAMYDED